VERFLSTKILLVLDIFYLILPIGKKSVGCLAEEIMSEPASTVEVCVYGMGHFLEFTYQSRFITVELTVLPLAEFSVKRIEVEGLKPGGGHQTFARLKRFLTERRFELPVGIAEKIIALDRVHRAFGPDGTRFSLEKHPFDELRRVLKEDLEAILCPPARSS
jgi:hypothetical protein